MCVFFSSLSVVCCWSNPVDKLLLLQWTGTTNVSNLSSCVSHWSCGGFQHKTDNTIRRFDNYNNEQKLSGFFLVEESEELYKHDGVNRKLKCPLLWNWTWCLSHLFWFLWRFKCKDVFKGKVLFIFTWLNILYICLL